MNYLPSAYSASIEITLDRRLVNVEIIEQVELGCSITQPNRKAE